MRGNLSVNIGKNRHVSLSDIERGIDHCMSEGLFLPSEICQKMGWCQDSVRNCLFHFGQHTIGQYVLAKRLSLLSDMAKDESITLKEAADIVGMRIAEVTRITRIHTGKSFMEQRREFQQRNANHSPVTHRHWHHHSSCR